METPKITPQMWLDWQHSKATEAVRAHLEVEKFALIEQLLNQDISNLSAEQLGLNYIAFRSKLDGIGEFLDFDGLELNIVQPEGDSHEA
jgi:hypothetical protein